MGNRSQRKGKNPWSWFTCFCGRNDDTTNGKKKIITPEEIQLPIFPDDIWIDILSLLPPKPLIRFKSISSTASTSVSEVLRLRRQKKILPMSGIFYTYFTQLLNTAMGTEYQIHRPQDSSLSSPPIVEGTNLRFLPKSPVVVLDSCNGLLLCQPIFDYISTSQDVNTYCYVCDPVTKRYVAIPKSKPSSGGPWPQSMVLALAFDPLFDPTHFKIIGLFYPTGGLHWTMELKVFSSMTGTWKEQTIMWDGGKVYTSAFYRGKLYMAGFPKSPFIIFDVRNESFEEMRLPGDAMSKHRACIGMSRQRLNYLVMDGSLLRVWVLDDDNEDEAPVWVLKHCIDNDKLFEETKPLAFHPDSDIIFLELKTKIISYHLTEESSEVISGHKTFRDATTCLLIPFSYFPDASLVLE